jgi:hypothetical protein
MFDVRSNVLDTDKPKIPAIKEEASFEDDFVRIIGSTPNGQGSMVEPEAFPSIIITNPPKVTVFDLRPTESDIV